MRQMAEFSARETKGFCAAVRKTIANLGGIEAASEYTGKSKTALSFYQSPHEDRWPPADVVMLLDMANGDPLIARAMGRIVGYDVVIHATDQGGGDPLVQLAKMNAVACDLNRRMIEAAADREYSLNEVDEIDAGIIAVENELARLKSINRARRQAILGGAA